MPTKSAGMKKGKRERLGENKAAAAPKGKYTSRSGEKKNEKGELEREREREKNAGLFWERKSAARKREREKVLVKTKKQKRFC